MNELIGIALFLLAALLFFAFKVVDMLAREALTAKDNIEKLSRLVTLLARGLDELNREREVRFVRADEARKEWLQ